MSFNFDKIIELDGPVRRFHPAHKTPLSLGMLAWDRVSGIGKGSSVNISEPVMRFYDHKVKVAVPIDFAGNDPDVTPWFVLFEELPPANQMQIRDFYPENSLICKVC